MGFETLKNIIEFNKAQKPADEEDVENNLCPYCAWELDVNSKNERSCPMCERIYK